MLCDLERLFIDWPGILFDLDGGPLRLAPRTQAGAVGWVRRPPPQTLSKIYEDEYPSRVQQNGGTPVFCAPPVLNTHRLPFKGLTREAKYHISQLSVNVSSL